MRRFRVSIAVLLTGIALVGVTLAALIHPSPLWGNAFYSLTLGTLTIVVLGAIHSRGRRRAFWVGFSVCGWAYFLAIFGPEPISRVQGELVTTSILEICYPLTIPKEAPGPVQGPAPAPPPTAGPKRLSMSSAERGRVILAGAFGGGGNAPVAPTSVWELWTMADRVIGPAWDAPRSFRYIGHSIFCLLFALIGGYAARRSFEIRERDESPSPSL
jgi:hypothetical protein